MICLGDGVDGQEPVLVEGVELEDLVAGRHGRRLSCGSLIVLLPAGEEEGGGGAGAGLAWREIFRWFDQKLTG